MYRLGVKIKVNKFVFDYCISVNIKSSWDNHVDTAKIVLPNAVYINTSLPPDQDDEIKNLSPQIKRNDPVWIWASYDSLPDDLELRFTGFVSRVNSKENIEVFCEDYMYLLKQINVPSKSWEQVTIKELIDYILQGTDIEREYSEFIPQSTKLGSFEIDNKNLINAVQILEVLRKTYGIVSYFDDKVLKIGRFTETNDKTGIFLFHYNILEDKLVHRRDEDLNLVLKGVSILENNTKIERWAIKDGDEVKVIINSVPGEQRTITFYNLDVDTLTSRLIENFDRYYYSGYTGSFKTFLEPLMHHRDKVSLYDRRFPYRNGTYRIRGVETMIDINGAYQRIELDYKIKQDS